MKQLKWLDPDFVTHIKFRPVIRFSERMFRNCYIFVSRMFQNTFNMLTLNKMYFSKKPVYLLLMSIIAILATAQTPAVSTIVEKEGLYFTDATQTKLYTGNYREYYDNGSLKLEMQIKNGSPEGTYVVYFENNKPKEIRSYKNGQFHGLWRSYSAVGQLISEAEYKNDKKHSVWRIWDENGTKRYEMNYNDGKKVGVWRMWNENGELTGEKKY